MIEAQGIRWVGGSCPPDYCISKLSNTNEGYNHVVKALEICARGDARRDFAARPGNIETTEGSAARNASGPPCVWGRQIGTYYIFIRVQLHLRSCPGWVGLGIHWWVSPNTCSIWNTHINKMCLGLWRQSRYKCRVTTDNGITCLESFRFFPTGRFQLSEVASSGRCQILLKSL